MLRNTMRTTIALLATSFVALATGPAAAQAISGVSVSELSDWDQMMRTFMTDNDITAGVLAVAKTDGTIVYQRGFGELFPGQPVPENTPMRIASLEKPITAAAIRKVDSDGLIDPNDFVFDLGQSGGGLLNYTPWNGLGDVRYPDITVAHLVAHRGGFNNKQGPECGLPLPEFVPDPQFNSINICDDLDIPDDPAGRDNTVRWMLSQPLQYDPGDPFDPNDPDVPDSPYCAQSCVRCYSNFGYMLIGLIVEQMTGQPLRAYVRNNILTPDMWVPSTEIIYGRSFENQKDPREPHYDFTGESRNVFDPDGDLVFTQYGGWEHEVFVGHGNLVMSAAALLVFMENYWVQSGGPSGMPLINGANGGGTHTGRVRGTSTIMTQRKNDGVNIVVLFNKDGSVPNATGGTEDFSAGMSRLVSDWITDLFANGDSLPDFAVDGFWVNFNVYNPFQVGGYNAPFTSMTTALASTTNGTKLRFFGGSSSWTGTINEKMRLDAPFATVRIGVQ